LRDRESNIFLSFFSPDDLGLKAYFEFDGFWGFIWDFIWGFQASGKFLRDSDVLPWPLWAALAFLALSHLTHINCKKPPFQVAC